MPILEGKLAPGIPNGCHLSCVLVSCNPQLEQGGSYFQN